MSDVIEEARRLKSRAMEARDRNDFETAIHLLSNARDGLADELTDLESKRAGESSPGRFEQDVATQLAHILGSMGGVYRRWGDYPASIDCYDAGYELERPGAPYNILNSYNMTQRLVSRAFMNPAAVSDGGISLHGLPLREYLEQAKEGIVRQRHGKRRRDEYAAADLAVVTLLLGDEDWLDKLDDFLHSTPRPEPYAIEVTLEVLEALRSTVAGAANSALKLKERLSEACDVMKAEIGA
jgi:hypothetical protein